MDRADAFKTILFAISDAAVFLFTTSAGIAALAAALMLGAVLKLWSALSSGRLMAEAAGESFGAGHAIGIALRELGGMGLKAAGALPILIGIAAVLATLVGISDAARKMDEYVEGRMRVAELTATVRNLDRRYKAIEVRVDDLADGRIKATLAFFDRLGAAEPARTQAVDLAGKELYLDAIVCNFDYSEIAAGRAVNLAIPYKVFSDQVPEAEGVALSILDDTGIPLMYRREPGELYGIANDAFVSRRGELMGLLRSDQAARGAGIARSLYGSAAHKAVRKGESFAVWVEQTGGLTIKEPSAF
jgi:hypothetical protein